MNRHHKNTDAGKPSFRHLYVLNGGFFRQKRLREILASAGYRVTLGLPDKHDLIGVWGMSPTSHRGRKIAARRGAQLVYIEDSFLRSMRPGRSGDLPMGLLIDHRGIHFDASTPSDLEILLNTHPLDNATDLSRARNAMRRMIQGRLSKYSGDDPDAPLPDPGYVLVIDQTRGDASVRASGGDRARFLEMLLCARKENPDARILVKTHPETVHGFRAGHFTSADAQGPVEIYDRNIAPMALLEGATRVYTLSSQMGFEAIIAGHRPRVFGTPFYAGWGLSDDETALPRRGRNLTSAQLFLAAMIYFPVWFDPYLGKRCELETVLAALEAQTRAWRADFRGWTAYGIRLWKRGFFQHYFGAQKRLIFAKDLRTPATGRPVMVWGNRPAPTSGPVTRVEDGFIRSRGLGAKLVPPVSLITDEEGIYFDPRTPSALEKAIIRCATEQNSEHELRAEKIAHMIRQAHLTKYNMEGQVPVLPEGRRILVTGQVENDASILMGCPDISTNEALLSRARQDNPDAVILWKPHPDVEAGLRPGRVSHPHRYADITLTETPIAQIYPLVHEIYTLTSLSGFEALLRGCQVTTLGVPFYAGWGLTRDLGPVPQRRLAAIRPSLNHLIYATLVTYPRYWDPVTGLPCPIETVLHRLTHGQSGKASRSNRLLAKAQGIWASYAYLWR